MPWVENRPWEAVTEQVQQRLELAMRYLEEHGSITVEEYSRLLSEHRKELGKSGKVGRVQKMSDLRRLAEENEDIVAERLPNYERIYRLKNTSHKPSADTAPLASSSLAAPLKSPESGDWSPEYELPTHDSQLLTDNAAARPMLPESFLFNCALSSGKIEIIP